MFGEVGFVELEFVWIVGVLLRFWMVLVILYFERVVGNFEVILFYVKEGILVVVKEFLVKIWFLLLIEILL